jgi:hypothetical protein
VLAPRSWKVPLNAISPAIFFPAPAEGVLSAGAGLVLMDDGPAAEDEPAEALAGGPDEAPAAEPAEELAGGADEAPEAEPPEELQAVRTAETMRPITAAMPLVTQWRYPADVAEMKADGLCMKRV